MDSSNTDSHTVAPENTMKLSTDKQIAEKQPPQETSLDNAAGEDLAAAACRLVGRSRSRRRRTHVRKTSKDGCSGGGEESTDEKAEVERKIVALQKIVPGGERLAVEALFEETAEYIVALEWQVKALRFLAAFVQSSEKKKRMRGG